MVNLTEIRSEIEILDAFDAIFLSAETFSKRELFGYLVRQARREELRDLLLWDLRN